MRTVIVGTDDGKRIIRWPQVAGLALGLSLILGFGTGCAYRLLSGAWDPVPCVLGLLGGGCCCRHWPHHQSEDPSNQINPPDMNNAEHRGQVGRGRTAISQPWDLLSCC
jgi:hypothetical protein